MSQLNQVRGQRDQRGASPQEAMRDARGSEKYGRGRGRGSVVNYYKDLGFSTSEEGYNSYKSNQAAYDKAKAKSQGGLDKAQADLNKSQGQYDKQKAAYNKGISQLQKPKTILENEWNRIKGKQLVRVGIYDKNNKRTGTTWTDHNTAFSVVKSMPKRYGGMVGKELRIVDHPNLGGMVNKLKGGYYQAYGDFMSKNRKAAQSAYNQSKSQFDKYAQQMNTYGQQIQDQKGAIKAGRAEIAGYDKNRANQLKSLQTQYADRAANLQKIFGGLKVEKGNATG